MLNLNSNLNAVNDTLITQYAAIQAEADNTQACDTLAVEVAHLNARGKLRAWLPQLATSLTGSFISKIADVMPEREITVYPTDKNTGKCYGEFKQSLNASLKMVALYSVLRSGHTDAKTIETAITNWLEEDSINENLNPSDLSIELITNMINAQILNSETGTALTEDGAHYDAYGVQDHINELRTKTMNNLWDKAQPRMQPMKHKITWRADFKGNAICEIPNLRLVNGKKIGRAHV